MAKIETNTIIASSLDNFLVFENENFTVLPYVLVGASSSNVGKNITLTFEDADDADAAKIVLEGKPNTNITSRTFNTSGSVTQLLFSLMECLKMNSIVYDIYPATANSLRMGLDSSRKWKITSSLTIGGNYSSFDPEALNKWVVMINGNIDNETSQFSLEKYNNNQEVSFNISAPFNYITSKYPFQINLAAYGVRGGTITMQTITNNKILILPTTLDKFETVDYLSYFSDASDGEKKNFLTRNFVRNYNYGEYIGLSLLTNRELRNINLVKKYYTNSGMYLTSKTSCVLMEKNYSRIDFYDTFDLDAIENQFNHQVGYVDVVAVQGAVEITNSIRYYVEPKCDKNDTLFFINAIGGLDSYNFTGEHKFASSINERTTYMKNPQRPFGNTYELEHTKQVEMESMYTSITSMINERMANWLTELQRSKYVFKYYPEEEVKYKMVLIDDMSIELSDNEKYYEIECKYRFADTGINI